MSADRSEKGFSSPFRPNTDRRRSTRFSFETLEPRIALSSVSGMVEHIMMASDSENDPPPGPDGNPHDDFPPIPVGPVLPA